MLHTYYIGGHTKASIMKNIRLFFCIMCIITSEHWVCAQTQSPADDEVTVNLSVTDMESKPRKSDKITFTGQKSRKSWVTVTNAEGKSLIYLKKGDTYEVYINNLSNNEKVKEFDVPETKNKITLNLELLYEPGRTITLKNVFFDTGKSTLRPESFAALNDLADALKLKPSLVIEIAGHTDNVGSKESNQVLSGQRAQSVRTYLLKKGIDGKRITTKGYGDTQPVGSNDTDEGRQQNRRTEVRIISE